MEKPYAGHSGEDGAAGRNAHERNAHERNAHERNAHERSADEKTSSGRGPAPNSPPFLVAGIGASAGGLEAFTRVLKSIPGDAPLALVLVQHLSRDHESLLPKLLSAHTQLTVLQGEDGQRLEPGHVYVIRPDTHMSVIDGA